MGVPRGTCITETIYNGIGCTLSIYVAVVGLCWLLGISRDTPFLHSRILPTYLFYDQGIRMGMYICSIECVLVLYGGVWVTVRYFVKEAHGGTYVHQNISENAASCPHGPVARAWRNNEC